MRNLYPFVLFLLLMYSCDPCEDCGEPLLSEPIVNMVFINQDSIVLIDSALIVYDSLDSSFTSVNGILSDLRDSLMQIQDSLDLGLVEYEDEKVALLDSIDILKPDSIFLDDLKIDSNANVLSSTRTTINSGLMRLDSFSLQNALQSTVIFPDSLTTWQLPLSFEGGFSAYQLFINNTEYTVELGYEAFSGLDEDRNITIRAQAIEVINHTFNDLDSCNENCIDGEATFIFYF